MRKQIPRILIFLAILLAVFLTYDTLVRMEYTRVFPDNAFADLSAFDLSQDTVFIDARRWAYYPERLYTPEDFAAGGTISPVIPDTPAASAEYGTFRLTLRLPADTAYGMYGKSLLNSQRIYIDGNFVDTVGLPGDSKAATTPSTKHYFYSFTPRGEETEIIFQVANFYTEDGGGSYPFYISGFTNVARFMYIRVFLVCMIAGCLLAAALFCLGMFIFSTKKHTFLYFALLCLLIALRAMVTEDKPLMELVPGISWRMMYTLEYLDMIALFACFVLYVDSLYSGLLRRGFVGVVLGVCGLFAGIVLLTEPLFYTAQVHWFYALWAIAGPWIIFKMTVRALRSGVRSLPAALITLGFVMLLAGAVNDVLYYVFQIGYIDNLLLQKSMLICLFLHMTALALDFSRTERELEAARLHARELHETNRLLDRMGRMKTDFLAAISHEMKTPLTVISTNAQYTRAIVGDGAEAEDEIRYNMTMVDDEAKRLARLVSDLLTLGSAQEARADMRRLDPGILLRQTAETYRRLLQERNNTLHLHVPEDLPMIDVNPDMLMQVVVNLLANAAAHTAHGEVFLSAVAEEGQLHVCVADTGSGFDPALLPHVFDRRTRDENGGEGLGLSICEQIIRQHGGEIWAENPAEGGAAVRFTLPAKEDERDA